MQAIQNLKSIFTNWLKILEPLSSTRANPIGISCNVKFLGLCVQMVKRYQGKQNIQGASHAHYEWGNIINKSVEPFILSGRTVPNSLFQSLFPSQTPFVIQRYFDTPSELRSLAEKAGKPIIALTQEDCRTYKNKGSKKITNIADEYFIQKNGRKKENQHYIAYQLAISQIDEIVSGLCKL